MCQECLKPVSIAERFSETISESLKDISAAELKKYNLKEPLKLFKAEGCAACGYKGTRGRVAIFEIFEMTHELEKIVLESPSEAKIEAETKRQGMIKMKQDGIMKALAGLVPIEEVLRVVEE